MQFWPTVCSENAQMMEDPVEAIELLALHGLWAAACQCLLPIVRKGAGQNIIAAVRLASYSLRAAQVFYFTHSKLAVGRTRVLDLTSLPGPISWPICGAVGSGFSFLHRRAVPVNILQTVVLAHMPCAHCRTFCRKMVPQRLLANCVNRKLLWVVPSPLLRMNALSCTLGSCACSKRSILLLRVR